MQLAAETDRPHKIVQILDFDSQPQIVEKIGSPHWTISATG
jgi:hypothetical protein